MNSETVKNSSLEISINSEQNFLRSYGVGLSTSVHSSFGTRVLLQGAAAWGWRNSWAGGMAAVVEMLSSEGS